MNDLGTLLKSISDFMWDIPLLTLFVGSGLFFLIYSRFLPFKYLGHAIQVLRGKYDNKDAPGHINHFQALSGALAATVGMGNVSGVSLAIVAGGPGVLFWMWICAFLGMTTKFFTCSLAVMYRGRDAKGQLQGGPMYVIREGLNKRWYPLAVIFCIAGFLGATPVFQANQMVAVVDQSLLQPLNLSVDFFLIKLILGIILAALTGIVIIGGIKRIGNVASTLVPSMVIVYGVCVLTILGMNYQLIIPTFKLILSEAFSAKAIAGGTLLTIIIEGAKRASFSNEAGIGTAPMMHGAAKTNEPIREGLVAMLGPAIDTLIVCTLTGLCVVISGLWKVGAENGIMLTAQAFEMSLSYFGTFSLTLCVLVFGFTTILGMAFYGLQCFTFLAGTRFQYLFNYWYVFIVLMGAVASLDVVVNIIFIGFGIMAIPTLLSSLLLSPKVLKASKDYFKTLKQ